MRSINRTIGLLVFSGFIILAGCKHKPPTPVPAANNNGGNGGGNNVDTGICFTRDILPIFTSNCARAGCHDAVSRQNGFQFTDYNSIIAKEFVPGNAEETELYEKITEDKADKRMPPPPWQPLKAEQIALVKRWIDEGAKNTTGCGSACDTNNFTYAANIQPILDKNCIGCHNGASAPKGIQLNSYTGTMAAVNSNRLLGAIKHLPGFIAMPYNTAKLTDCEIRQIEKWVQSGALNN